MRHCEGGEGERERERGRGREGGRGLLSFKTNRRWLCHCGLFRCLWCDHTSLICCQQQKPSMTIVSSQSLLAGCASGF